MDVEDCEGKSAEQITNTDEDNPIPKDMVTIRTRLKKEEVSPPPKSALGKIRKNLAKYDPFKELSDEDQGTLEFLASRDELKGYGSLEM